MQKYFVSGIAVPVFDSISSFSGYQDLLIVIFAYLWFDVSKIDVNRFCIGYCGSCFRFISSSIFILVTVRCCVGTHCWILFDLSNISCALDNTGAFWISYSSDGLGSHFSYGHTFNCHFWQLVLHILMLGHPSHVLTIKW